MDILNKETPVKSTVKHLTARQRLQFVYRTRTMETGARAELLYSNSHNNVKEARMETYDYRRNRDAVLSSMGNRIIQ